MVNAHCCVAAVLWCIGSFTLWLPTQFPCITYSTSSHRRLWLCGQRRVLWCSVPLTGTIRCVCVVCMCAYACVCACECAPVCVCVCGVYVFIYYTDATTRYTLGCHDQATHLWPPLFSTSVNWRSLPVRICWDIVRAGTFPCSHRRTPPCPTLRYPTMLWAMNMAAPRGAYHTGVTHFMR